MIMLVSVLMPRAVVRHGESGRQATNKQTCSQCSETAPSSYAHSSNPSKSRQVKRETDMAHVVTTLDAAQVRILQSNSTIYPSSPYVVERLFGIQFRCRVPGAHEVACFPIVFDVHRPV